jgi:cell wall-associated NlpC family hydrolase
VPLVAAAPFGTSENSTVNVAKNGKYYPFVNHVGIYIGNGQFIHVSDETNKVTTDSIITGMYKDAGPYYATWAHK